MIERIPNHYSPSLSPLDLSMVKAVPPGGNWKYIPESIPSKRLEQIRQGFAAGNGSRSTYYGRLHPDQPAYTISTCFNRPGNGCNIHYDFEGGQHRLISQREGARLQSFPDSFVFLGSRASVYKQIGNAVPPVLAYQVAKALGEPGCFVDLFCGAGGLSLGFVWAGWDPIVSSDIDPTFLATHARNIRGEVVCGDIRDSDVLHDIVAKAEAARRRLSGPLFVLGGPPCQGFSTAGNRRSGLDQRNGLFKDYVNILLALQPDGFVFENVTGILNMENGRFFATILDSLGSCGHRMDVLKVRAEEFAVPQRRTRVFVIGRGPDHKALALAPVTSSEPQQGLVGGLLPAVSVSEALSDLPPLEPGEDGSYKEYLVAPTTPYQALMRGALSIDDYLSQVRGGRK